jgi:hypothetical protein
MKRIIRISFFTITIWITSALINAVLYAAIFSMGKLVNMSWDNSLGGTFIFTMIYAAPSIFCLWLVFLYFSSHEKLTVILLKATLILSLISSLLIPSLPNAVVHGHYLLLAIIIVVSAFTSVLLHHKLLKSFQSNQISTNV